VLIELPDDFRDLLLELALSAGDLNARPYLADSHRRHVK
jgi:hypothetical protein